MGSVFRLKVPAIRSVLEYLEYVCFIESVSGQLLTNLRHSFVLLFLLFIVVLETNTVDRINGMEWVFMVYGIGMQY